MTEAASYTIVAMRPRVTAWVEVETGLGREEAIERARNLLDNGPYVAASVQGRGTQEHPTPSGEVQPYRGVASGYVPGRFWMLPTNPAEVEVRPAHMSGVWSAHKLRQVTRAKLDTLATDLGIDHPDYSNKEDLIDRIRARQEVRVNAAKETE